MSFTRVVLIAIVTFSAACDQAPTRPAIPEQPPIVTGPSTTPGSISGNWSGTFDTTDPADCHTNTPASASFIEDDDDDGRVHGTLSAVNACGFDQVGFNGTNEAGNLRGALSVGGLSGQAAGTLSGDVLELHTTDMRNSTRDGFVIPAGVMHLHRQ